MNTKKRISIAIFFVLLVLVFTAYILKRSHKSEQTIVIATLVSHPILDAVQKGCLAELREHGFGEPETRIVFKNANGQINDTAIIANSLPSEHPSLIIAISTPMSQAIASAHLTVPLVFGAVTDPVGARLVPSLGNAATGNITGTSDAVPYEAVLHLIKRITPKVERLGIIYNPGEAAAQYGIKELKRLTPNLGITLVEGAISTSNDVGPVAENLSSRCDAILLSGDNTAVGGINGALKVAFDHKRPLYAPDSGTVEKGAMAAVSVDYEALGRETGKLAIRMLQGERNIPVYVTSGDAIFLNSEGAARMGCDIPADVRKDAVKVFDHLSQ